MRFLDLVFICLGGAAAFGGYTLFAWPAGGPGQEKTVAPRLPVVETAVVELADSVASIRQTALMRASSDVPVTAEVAGRVVWINDRFQLGRSIPAGARVFELDPARLETEVDKARADISAAEAELERLEKELTRISALAERNISTQANLATTTANLAAAEATLLQRRASLKAAEIALAQATFVAPFDAVVSQETLSLGQFLQPGTEVGRLVAADEAELLVRLNATQLQAIGAAGDLVGKEVLVTATDGSAAAKTGTIRRIALTTEASTQTTAVLVAVRDPFEGEGGVFRINGLFDVAIPLAAESTPLLSVPVTAVQTGNRVWGVADGALVQLDAQIERRDGNQMILRSDELEAGFAVVTTRLPNAVEGLKVRVVEPIDPAAGAAVSQ